MTIKEIQLALSIFSSDSSEEAKVVLLIDGKEIQINSIYLDCKEGKVEIVGEWAEQANAPTQSLNVSIKLAETMDLAHTVKTIVFIISIEKDKERWIKSKNKRFHNSQNHKNYHTHQIYQNLQNSYTCFLMLKLSLINRGSLYRYTAISLYGNGTTPQVGTIRIPRTIRKTRRPVGRRVLILFGHAQMNFAPFAIWRRSNDLDR